MQNPAHIPFEKLAVDYVKSPSKIGRISAHLLLLLIDVNLVNRGYSLTLGVAVQIFAN